MNASEFAQVRKSLQDGDYVKTSILRQFVQKANDTAFLLMRVPAYELVQRDLEFLIRTGSLSLLTRLRDPSTARELESK